MIRRPTTYLVTDIEADGLVPGRHSMISIGSVVVDLPLFDRPRERGLTVSGLDLPSLAMGVLGWDRQDCDRHRYPAEWLAGHDHTHRAIDDALGYAGLLRHLLETRGSQPRTG